MQTNKKLKGPTIERVEREQGATVPALLSAFAAEQLSQAEAAERLGVSQSVLSLWVVRLGLDWPKARLLAARRRGQLANAVWVEIEGERKTLTEWARVAKVSPRMMAYRYQRGLRGRDLLAPSSRSIAPGTYALGLTLREWSEVGALARARGARATARKLGLPLGAVNAYLRGEVERLD